MSLSVLLSAAAVYALAGIFAGLLSGLMGIGGGLVVVPAMLFIFHLDPTFPQNLSMQMAAGTSLAVMFFTSQSSIRAHYRQSTILWSVYNRLWPGIILGTIAGALLANMLPTRWLESLFGLFLLFVATRIALSVKESEERNLRVPAAWINGLLSILIGFMSGLLGVGGGTLIIPYLHHCGLNMRKIAPISALCTLTVASIGSLSFIATGWHVSGLPAYSTGFVYWPAVFFVAIFSSLFAPLGARLTYILPIRQLKCVFVLIVVLTAINLLHA